MEKIFFHWKKIKIALTSVKCAVTETKFQKYKDFLKVIFMQMSIIISLVLIIIVLVVVAPLREDQG